MKLFRILSLALIVAASTDLNAQTQSSFGEAQVQTTELSSAVIIRGDAATALYDALAKKVAVEVCDHGTSVTLAPMICVRSVRGTTCYSSLVNGDSGLSFAAPDICNRPQMSIIGVGNIREVESDGIAIKPDVRKDLLDRNKNKHDIRDKFTPCTPAP